MITTTTTTKNNKQHVATINKTTAKKIKGEKMCDKRKYQCE